MTFTKKKYISIMFQFFFVQILKGLYYYFIDRINLINKYKKTKVLSFDISDKMYQGNNGGQTFQNGLMSTNNWYRQKVCSS